jgi:hypothetical protein
MVCRRLGSWCSYVIKFLLFREDQPKHSVWQDFNPIHMAIVMPLSVILLGVLVSVGYFAFGVPGFFVAYICATVLALEVPHCIFDR